MSGFSPGRPGHGLAGGLPNGVKMAAIAFLIHQLMKQRNGGAQAPAGGGGGGLGDILGSLLGGGAGGGLGGGLGGGAGGGLGGALGGLLGGGNLGGLLGGLAGMLGGMRSQGLGRQVDSWIAPGGNEQVSAEELERQFDPRELDEAAQQAGTDRGGLLEELRQVMPEFVDRLTPQGTLPQPGATAPGEGDLGSSMDGILRGTSRPR
jgi:uncharacterized protein YidB (DUF937 family)